METVTHANPYARLNAVLKMGVAKSRVAIKGLRPVEAGIGLGTSLQKVPMRIYEGPVVASEVLRIIGP